MNFAFEDPEKSLSKLDDNEETIVYDGVEYIHRVEEGEEGEEEDEG